MRLIFCGGPWWPSFWISPLLSESFPAKSPIETAKPSRLQSLLSLQRKFCCKTASCKLTEIFHFLITLATGWPLVFWCGCIFFFAVKLNQFDVVAFFSDKKSYLAIDQNYTKALHFYMPKWKGFLLNEATEPMDATEALTRLNMVVDCLSNVWVQEGLSQPRRKPTSFKSQKVDCYFSMITL